MDNFFAKLKSFGPNCNFKTFRTFIVQQILTADKPIQQYPRFLVTSQGHGGIIPYQ
jgi:hypothetical protein